MADLIFWYVLTHLYIQLVNIVNREKQKTEWQGGGRQPCSSFYKYEANYV